MSATKKDLIISVAPEATENMLVSARAYQVGHRSPSHRIAWSCRWFLQTELMEQAKSENIIVCLPTGSGKTYIAVMLIKEMSSSIRVSWKDGGKRTVFLVKTGKSSDRLVVGAHWIESLVQLVDQQSNYIRIHTGLAVGCYYGDLGVDFWRKDKWMEELESHQVLVFTAQVFLDLIDHNYFCNARCSSLLRSMPVIFYFFSLEQSKSNHLRRMSSRFRRWSLRRTDEEALRQVCRSSTCARLNRVDQWKENQTERSPRKCSRIGEDLSVGRLCFSSTNKRNDGYCRARIETGSNRSESVRYGTLVNVETIPCPSYREKILKDNESLLIPFEVRDTRQTTSTLFA